MVDVNQILEKINEGLIAFAPKILLAVVILVIGLWIIKFIVKGANVVLKKKHVAVELKHFLDSLISISLKIVLFIIVIGVLGVQTTSFVAILAAAGFAVGLALQGSLGNFAGGVLILFFKPFKIGDFIEAQGESGIVKKIEIFTTTLNTGDNKTIILPNGPLSNGNITNYSTEPTRRVDLEFGISYDDDIKKAKQILEKLVVEDKRVLKDPDYQIVVGNLGASSVDIKVRAWVNSGDYWGFFFDMQEKVKLTFDKEKISIPYPQMDIHQKR